MIKAKVTTEIIFKDEESFLNFVKKEAGRITAFQSELIQSYSTQSPINYRTESQFGKVTESVINVTKISFI